MKCKKINLPTVSSPHPSFWVPVLVVVVTLTEYAFWIIETSQKTTLLGWKWWDWDWDNGGTVLETENLNQGPHLPVLVFAGYGTINQTPLPQLLKRTSPINRTRNVPPRRQIPSKSAGFKSDPIAPCISIETPHGHVSSCTQSQLNN